jgi:hypothetical protein
MSSINFSIGADNKKFTQVARDTQNKAAAMAQRVSARMSAMAVAAGVVIAAAVTTAARAVLNMARKMSDGLRGAFDLGGSLSDLSARTGAAVKDIVVLQQAFLNAGLGQEQMTNGIGRLQRALAEASKGSKAAKNAFASLGLNFQEVLKQDPVTQFRQVGDAITRLSDPAMRTAVAMQIFGRSGQQLLTVFSDGRGGMELAAQQVGKQAELLNQNATKFDEVSDKLSASGLVMRGFFVGMASVLADPLLKILDSFAKIDLVEMGKKAGQFILDAANVFQAVMPWIVAAGKMFQAGISGGIGFAFEVANLLWEGAQRFWDIMQSGWGFISGLAAQFVGGLTEGVIGIALDLQTALEFAFDRVVRFFDSAMGPVIDRIQAGLEWAVQQALAGLAKIPWLNKKLGLEGFQAQSFDQILSDKENERAARQAEPERSYGEMRAANFDNSPLMQAGMGTVEKMNAWAAEQYAKGAEKFSDAQGPKMPAIEQSVIDGFYAQAQENYGEAVDAIVGPSSVVPVSPPTDVVAAASSAPATLGGGLQSFADDYARRNAEFGFSAGGMIRAKDTTSGKAKDPAVDAQQETNDKLDELLAAFEAAWK